MLRKSDNILHRLFDREISAAAPNAHVNRARMLYENIVPSFTVYDVECPDYSFRKFSNDGQYLICFSRNYQDLIVYRHNWLNYCCKGESFDTQEELPLKAKKFESYFSQLYSLNLASGNELICKDFFLATDCNCYGVFATATSPDSDAPPVPGTVPGVPSIEKITIYLIRLADGTILDERKFHDDFIHLVHNVGIFMYDDLLSILSVRYQAVHILQVREAGTFVDVRTIGPFCREDDELTLSSHIQMETSFQNEHKNSHKTKRSPEDEKLFSEAIDTGYNASFELHPHEHTFRRENPAHEILESQPNYVNSRNGSASGTGPMRTFRISQDSNDISPVGFWGGRQQNYSRESHATGVSFAESQYIFNRITERPRAALNGSTLGGGTEVITSAGYYARMPGHLTRGREQLLQAHTTRGDGGVHTLSRPSISYSTSSDNQIKRSRSQSLNQNSSSDIISSGCYSDLSISGGSLAHADHGAGSYHTSEGSVEYIVSRREMAADDSRRQVSHGEGSRSRNVQFHSEVSREHLDIFDGSGIENIYLTSSTPIHTTASGHAGSRLSQGYSSRSITSGEVHDAGPSMVQTSLSTRAFNGSLTSARETVRGSTYRATSPERPSQEATSSDANIPSEAHTNVERNSMLGGVKQRLLSFIFRTIESQELDPSAKAQRLKRFYYHFQHYADLVMWKVQFLDRYHLLIKFGSVDGVVSTSADTSHQTAFFVVYNIESTEILGFYQNSSEELLQLFEKYYDHFRVAARYPSYMRFISSCSNNKSARDQLMKQKAACNNTKSSNYAQIIKRTLASLPCNSQSHSPSAYFDQSLFHFDEKLISATDQYKPCMEHPIKFISRRRPNILKFKINPGLESGAGDGRGKKIVSFIFHPVYPFAISVQQAFMQQSVVNFHFRR